MNQQRVRLLAVLLILLLTVTACVGPEVREPAVEDKAPPKKEAPKADEGHQAAVFSLINQAQTAYQAGDYQYAIVSAERGLRIDRREPALYLWLARSYLELAEPRQADEFARQGLRYSHAGSDLAKALEAVREQLRSRGPTLRF